MVVAISFRYIQSRSHRNMVLSVSTPTHERRDDEGLALNYVGCRVTLQKKRTTQLGSAHQKWRVDADTGYVHAFHTNHLDSGEQRSSDLAMTRRYLCVQQPVNLVGLLHIPVLDCRDHVSEQIWCVHLLHQQRRAGSARLHRHSSLI